MLWRIDDGVSFVEVPSIRTLIACFLNDASCRVFPRQVYLMKGAAEMSGLFGCRCGQEVQAW